MFFSGGTLFVPYVAAVLSVPAAFDATVATDGKNGAKGLKTENLSRFFTPATFFTRKMPPKPTNLSPGNCDCPIETESGDGISGIGGIFRVKVFG